MLERFKMSEQSCVILLAKNKVAKECYSNDEYLGKNPFNIKLIWKAGFHGNLSNF